MSVKYICDVCESEYAQRAWQGTDAITMVFPAHAVGDVSEGEDNHQQMDVCSWECVHAFAGQIAAPDAPEEENYHLHDHNQPPLVPDEWLVGSPEEVEEKTHEDPPKEAPGHRMVRLKNFDTEREMADKNFDPRKNQIPGLKVDGRPV